ncbi:protein translocase subunit SecF [Psychrobacter sanguinis]|uniref:protein translocase subunit SecF n=1 Tax=Psychrobacter sanguinis TaxID=861445 RepID=UPI0019187AD0|nr:protein translocase subunit SecF [Psychrobacter sanguinis]MCC3308029.1 protein translocase subunit SecF [Psychrobacter sanguinis]MDY3307689.1 protein translocase subunit SecF [Psychrobacter sanguinis]UEC25315.1 protein translocase subunit SecF [Psychrobacter sanguinis]
MSTNNQNDNQNTNSGTPQSSTPAYVEGGRRRRRGPRRDGKGNNTALKAPNEKTDLDNTELMNPVELDSDIYEDEAALAEGGIKAVGSKRIIPFMKLEKPMAIFSAIMILVSIAAIFINGLNLGLDFTGGVSADVKYEKSVEQAEVIQSLEKAGFEDAVVQYLGGTTELLVRLPPQSDNVEGLNESLGKALDLPNNHASISNVNIIGSQVGGEVYLSSMLAILTALGMMMLYVAVRFQFKLAVGALLALVHDAVVTVGIFALFQFPFDLTVLAAILALIGYSLNDTIVVFDRIRENFRRVRDATPRQIVDLSLTETLRRTIMTVSTVLVVVLAMLFLGGDGLFWFSVAFFIGLIAGTYSSTYISSSIPLAMGLSRDDFVVKIKPEFQEEVVTFNDPKSFED